MIAFIKIHDDKKNDKGAKYNCSLCGALIAYSGALIKILGSQEHSYVNPAGIRCDFLTFIECHNVLVDRQLYLRHSWFNGYGWRFLNCVGCLQHLGWKYDAVKPGVVPQHFFGLLKMAIQPSSPDE